MNLRHALRSLAHDWRFTAFVFVILALGIGVNTAIYTLVDAILFRPLGLPAEERLVRVFPSEPDGTEMGTSMSYPVFTDYVEQSRSFQKLAAFASGIELDLSTKGSEPEQASGTLASGSYFATLGVGALRGRAFDERDDRPGNHVAVISEPLWRSRFDSSPAVIGATLRVNSTPFTIIGVMPSSFRGASIDYSSDVWVPISSVVAAWPGMADDESLRDRRTSWVSIVGRLREGVTLQQAQSELRTIAARRAKEQGKDRDPSATLVSATTAAIDLDRRVDVRRVAMLVMLFVALILAIACINAGGLQLVRGERRQRELAIRTALGASRRRIVFQLAGESLILALASGIAGIAIAKLVVHLLGTVAPDDFPLLLHASLPMIDPRVVGVTAGLTIITAFVFGVIPALRSSRFEVGSVMKGTGTLPRRLPVQSALVATQIALSAVLLVFAALMLRTLGRITSVKTGFPTAGAVVGSLNASRQGYVGPAARRFYENVRERLLADPQVESAAFARAVPVTQEGMRMTVDVPGYEASSDEDLNVDLNIVTPGYFRTLGVPLLRGRDFDVRDDGETDVAIINDAMARRFWPAGDALGAQMKGGPSEGLTVIGIAATTRRNSLREDPVPSVFIPLSQFPARGMTALVRTRDGSTTTAVQSLHRAVRAVDDDIPLVQVRTLEQHVGDSIARERTLAILLGGFGVLALLLASAGLFGVVAYQTAIRRREFGVRVALGAARHDIARIVVRRTVVLVASGALAGLVASWFLTRFAEGLLFGVTTRDPLSFVAVPLVLLVIGSLAAMGPVRQAVSVAPAEALRYE